MTKIIYILLLLLIPLISFSQGDEKITNGGFTNGTGWTLDSQWTIGSGVAVFDATDNGSISQLQGAMVSSVETDTPYTLLITVSNATGRPYFQVTSTTGQVYVSASGYDDDQTISLEFTTPSNIGDGGIKIYAWTDTEFSIDDVSLKERDAIGSSPYYVSPDGNDGSSGDITHPWLTWQKGFNEAQAGDTVYFRGGVYYADGATILDSTAGYGHNGTYSNRIVFMAYPDEVPILDLSNYIPTTYNSGIQISYTTYVTFKGLTVRNVWQRVSTGISAHGIEAYACSNLIFENCTVHDIGGRGFGFFGGFGNHGVDERIPDVLADTVRYINCDVYNICDTLCNVAGGPCILGEDWTPGGIADGFKFDNTVGSYVSFEGCRAWNYSDNGIDVSSSVCAYINRCWTFNSIKEYGEGGGMKYGALRENITTVTRRITNTLSAFNGWLGFDENNSGDAYYPINGEFYNNISYANWRAFGNFSYRTDPETVYNNKYKNNISYKDTTGARANEGGDIIEDYNSWQTDVYQSPPIESVDRFTITDYDFANLPADLAECTTVLGAARQADGSLPDIGDYFKLALTSELVGAGIGVGLMYDGDGNLRNQDTISLGPFDPLSSEVSDPDDPVYPSMVTSTPTYNAVSATLLGEIENNGGAEITASGFVWGTSVNPTLSSGNIAPNTTRTETTFSNSISPLQKGTTYHVRSYATNSAGTAYGSDVSFITPALGMIQSGGKSLFYNGKQIIY